MPSFPHYLQSHENLGGCVYTCIYVCMYSCMYVCICNAKGESKCFIEMST